MNNEKVLHEFGSSTVTSRENDQLILSVEKSPKSIYDGSPPDHQNYEMIEIKDDKEAIVKTDEDVVDALPDDTTVVAKKKSFDFRCLFIGLMVLLVMIGAVTIAILAHKFQTDVNFEFRFANHFDDNMVLQRSPHRAVVWGYASFLSENASIVLELQSEEIEKVYYAVVHNTVAGMTWTVLLDERSETSPFKIIASLVKGPHAPSKIELYNIVFGDVWICAGGDHLELPVSELTNSSLELSDFEEFANVRLFSLNPSRSDIPWFNVRNLKHSWSIPTKDIVSGTSAVCWLFVKQLSKQLKSPVGLITTLYATTFIDEWSPFDVVEKCSSNNNHNNRISQIWNAMVHPLLGMSSYGVIWYHGEKDAMENPHSYNCTVAELLSRWRSETHKHIHVDSGLQTTFAIIPIVPGNKASQYSYGYTDLRWKQTANFGFLPNKFMPHSFLIPSIDLPDANSTTQRSLSQQVLAQRLLNGVLSYGYNRTVINPLLPSKYSINLNNGSLTLLFEHSVIHVNNESGFEVCCSKNRSLSCSSSFVKVVYAPGREWVSASIVEGSGRMLVLDIQKCRHYVVGIRYLWEGTPCNFQSCPIYDTTSGFPMSPYIRFNMKDDGSLIDIQNSQVHLM